MRHQVHSNALFFEVSRCFSLCFFLKNGPFRSEKIEDSEPRVHPNSPLAVVARPQVVRHTCVSVAALIFLDSFQISKFSKCPTCFNMFMPIYTILGKWFSHLSLFNLLATSFLTHPTLRLGVWLCSHHLHLKESCKLLGCSIPEILWYLHFLIKNDKCRSEVCIIGKDSQLKV